MPAIQSVYQPIVNLRTGAVVAFEALARGPRGGDWESPAALFAHAAAHGLEAEMEFACQAAAMRGALRQRLPASVPLFVNVEPRWLGTPRPKDLASVVEQAQDRLQLVVEITERALIDNPAELLSAVRRIRANGWGVALDDVGADPASLALMPFIEPDVIKLDLRLIHEHTRAEIAEIINAVIAHAERSDALILAEGIETEEHRAKAMSMGAVLGQGWLFGRPGSLPDRYPPHAVHELSFSRENVQTAATPFDLIRRVRPVQTAAKRLLLPMSHHLERHALRTTEKPVLLTAFEDVNHFTPGTAARYRDLALRCSFVGALGAGMDAYPIPGVPSVRGAHLELDDRLRGEWVVCVVGPHFAGALIAKDLNDTGPDRERRFDMTITYDRDLVLHAARTLFQRINDAPPQ